MFDTSAPITVYLILCWSLGFKGNSTSIITLTATTLSTLIVETWEFQNGKNPQDVRISVKLRKRSRLIIASELFNVPGLNYCLYSQVKFFNITTHKHICIQLVISIACSMLILKYSILVMKWYWTINNTSILYSCDYVTSGHAICIYCERWMLWIFIREYKTNRTDILRTYPFFNIQIYLLFYICSNNHTRETQNYLCFMWLWLENLICSYNI